MNAKVVWTPAVLDPFDIGRQWVASGKHFLRQAKRRKDCKLYTASIGHRIACVLFGKRRSRADKRSGLGAKTRQFARSNYSSKKTSQFSFSIVGTSKGSLTGTTFQSSMIPIFCILTRFLFSDSLTNSQSRFFQMFQEWRHLNGNCPSSTITGCVQ